MNVPVAVLAPVPTISTPVVPESTTTPDELPPPTVTLPSAPLIRMPAPLLVRPPVVALVRLTAPPVVSVTLSIRPVVLAIVPL